MPRWECPEGKHPGVIGPARPRRDHACRYCLDCTRTAGKLVPRTCPAADNRKRRAEERAAEAAGKRAARALLERQALAAARNEARKRKADGRHSYPGNLPALARRWSKLKAWGGNKPTWRGGAGAWEANPARAWAFILWRLSQSCGVRDRMWWRFAFFAAIKEVFGDFTPGMPRSSAEVWDTGVRAIVRAVGGERALRLADSTAVHAVDVLRDALLENDPAHKQQGGRR